MALKERGGLPLLGLGLPGADRDAGAGGGRRRGPDPAAARARPSVAWTARRSGQPSRARVALYFGAIGFAFMFVEIAFIQKFTLFLAHPLYAVAVVLCAFLVFAGLGSRASARLRAVDGRRWIHPTILAAVVIGAIALGYLAVLPALFDWLLPLPDAARILISIALIAPLAFAMGIPFPTGSRASRRRRRR